MDFALSLPGDAGEWFYAWLDAKFPAFVAETCSGPTGMALSVAVAGDAAPHRFRWHWHWPAAGDADEQWHNEDMAFRMAIATLAARGLVAL